MDLNHIKPICTLFKQSLTCSGFQSLGEQKEGKHPALSHSSILSPPRWRGHWQGLCEVHSPEAQTHWKTETYMSIHFFLIKENKTLGRLGSNFKRLTIPTISKDTRELELSYTASRNTKWIIIFQENLVSFMRSYLHLHYNSSINTTERNHTNRKNSIQILHFFFKERVSFFFF